MRDARSTPDNEPIQETNMNNFQDHALLLAVSLPVILIVGIQVIPS